MNTLKNRCDMAMIICLLLSLVIVCSFVLPIMEGESDYTGFLDYFTDDDFEDTESCSLLTIIQINNEWFKWYDEEKSDISLYNRDEIESMIIYLALVSMFAYTILLGSFALIVVAIKRQPDVLRLLSIVIAIMVLMIFNGYTRFDKDFMEQYQLGAGFYVYMVSAVLMIFAAKHMKNTLEDYEYYESRAKKANMDADSMISSGNKAPIKINKVSTADELKKFKELLDMGVITAEEFDAQKTKLLKDGAGFVMNMPPDIWTCVCGRNHPKYVSSCTCGMSKSDILNSECNKENTP